MPILGLKILGGCDVGPIPIFQFYAGEDRILKFQVLDDSGCGCSKFNVPNTTVKELHIPATPTDLIIPDGSIIVDSGDASIFTVSLSAAQTIQMVSGDLKLILTDVSGKVRIAYAVNVIKLLTTTL